MKTLSFISILFGALTAASAIYTVPTGLGQIKGAYVQYKDADEVTLSVGYGECSGFYWEVTSATDVTLTPPSAADFVYIYIDDSASSYPTPTFIGSTTEPAYSEAKLGWYNDDDRCIGAVYTKASTTDIYAFDSFENAVYPDEIIVASNPNGSFQHTETSGYDTDIDDVTPVVCQRVRMKMFNNGSVRERLSLFD